MSKNVRLSFLLAYYGLITYLSSRSHFGSNVTLFPHFDKIVHFFEFAIFGFLLGLVLHFDKSVVSKKWKLALLLLFFAAGLDEVHQWFVPGRQFDLLDLLADMLGGIFGFTLCRYKRKKKIS